MSAVKVDLNYLVALTQQLIRFPSTNPPGDVREITDFIEKELKGFNLQVERYTYAPEKPNLVARWRGEAPGPTLIFYDHSDVVPVRDDERPKWKHDPFAGVVENNTVYGRGANDSKGKLAAMIAAAKAIYDSGIKLKGEVRFIIEADGEVGDEMGLKAMLKANPELLKGDMVIGCEPSELKIIRAYKGRLWLRVRVYGKTVHSIVPHTGVNANEKMLKVLPALLETPFTEDVQREFDDELLGGETRVLTTIKGGDALNVAPGYCEATLDIRLMPGQTVAGVMRDLQATVDRLCAEDPDLKVEIEPVPGSPRDPVVLSKDEPVIRALSAAYEKVAGKPAEFGPGFSLGGLQNFREVGVPGVYFGFGNIWSAHRENEYATFEELELTARTYAQLIQDVCGAE